MYCLSTAQLSMPLSRIKELCIKTIKIIKLFQSENSVHHSDTTLMNILPHIQHQILCVCIFWQLQTVHWKILSLKISVCLLKTLHFIRSMGYMYIFQSWKGTLTIQIRDKNKKSLVYILLMSDSLYTTHGYILHESQISMSWHKWNVCILYNTILKKCNYLSMYN